MEITPELIQAVLYIVIIISIVVFLVKKAVKLALCLAAVLLIFNIGYQFDGSDMKEKLQINDYVDSETATKISDFFDDFDSKREEYGIVDTDKVYDKMTETIEKGYYIVVDGLGKIDIDKFAKTLAQNIYDAGLKDIDFDELIKEIQKQLNVSKEEAEKIAIKVQEEYKNTEKPNNWFKKQRVSLLFVFTFFISCDIIYIDELGRGG